MADKVVARWRSERLEREVTLARWGSFGQPLVLFPTAGPQENVLKKLAAGNNLFQNVGDGKFKDVTAEVGGFRPRLAGEALPRVESHALRVDLDEAGARVELEVGDERQPLRRRRQGR